MWHVTSAAAQRWSMNEEHNHVTYLRECICFHFCSLCFYQIKIFIQRKCLNHLVCFRGRLTEQVSLCVTDLKLNCRAVRVANLKVTVKNLCWLVSLCRGGKGTATNLSWPSHFNFTPSHHQPPDLILLLFKLSRNSSCFSATTSSICPSLPFPPNSFVPSPPSPNVDYTSLKAPLAAFWCQTASTQITKSWAAAGER